MKNKIKSYYRLKSIALLMLLFPMINLLAQNSSVRGVVVDEGLIPVAQAVVTAASAQKSVETNRQGEFVIESPQSAELVVSKKGFLSVKIKPEGISNFVMLRVDKKNADMPVAYGTTRAGSVTSSMSVVDGKNLNNSVSALGSALYGKLPGLFLQQGSGEPGEDQPLYAFIRGKATIGSASNQPLIFVDGFERDMNSIQVEDVESVAVLKDAAATALYGARGANGIIQITTKRGQEGRVRCSANLQYGLQSANVLPEFLNSYDFSNKYRRAYEMDYVPWDKINGTTEEKAPYLTGLAARYQEANVGNYLTGDPYYYPNIDWVKEMVKSSAPRRQADINISGGNKIGRYYVSVNYLGIDGLYKHSEDNADYSSNSTLDRIRYRSNIDVNITKNWTLKADLSGQVDTKNRPMASTTDLWNSFYKTPANQYPMRVNNNVYGGTALYTMNPLAEMEKKGYRMYHERSLMSNIETRYDLSDFVKGLQVGLRIGYDNTYSNREGWQRNYSVAEVLSKDPVTGNPVLGSTVGTSTNLSYFGPDSDLQEDRTTFEGFAEYKRTFAGVHHINSMLMYHQDKYILNGEAKPYKYQFVGGRLGYDLKNKYFGEFSFSYSGTESFAKSNRFGFYPALSAGWVLSEEEFMKSLNFIDYLKVRGSAGLVGNSAVGERFTYVKQYVSSTGWVFGNNNAGVSGLAEGSYPNTDFSAEKAYKYEVGFEANLFHNFNIWSNLYLEHRTDILTTQSGLVPAVFGGSLANVNAGTTERKGVELGITLSEQKKDWGYSIGLTGAYNTSEILKINEEAKPESYLYTQGKAIGQPFLLESVGFFKDAADIAASPVQKFGEVKPGDIKYKDQNGVGQINDNDYKAFKNPSFPKAELGLDLSFRYRGFDIGAFFQSQLGRSVNLLESPYIFAPLQNNSARISTFAANSWIPETAETADYPRLSTQSNTNNYKASTFWYKNGDFIRLRSVELGYSLPRTLLKRLKVSQTRVFVRGLNLFTWDHLDQVDPEVLSGYPVMKSYNVGINLQF